MEEITIGKQSLKKPVCRSKRKKNTTVKVMINAKDRKGTNMKVLKRELKS